MVVRRFALAVFAALLAGIASAQEFRVGSNVSDFTVSTLDGAKVSFSSFRGSTTVIAFIATQCPVSNAYNSRMNALYSDYAAKGVKFLFINSNATEPANEVKAHAQRVGFTFPVHKDPNNIVADRFGAHATPEMFVIDTSGVIRYHGSIDDSQNEAHVKTQRLRNALDAVLAGKNPEVSETKAFGCSIKRVQKTS
jgi:peroxiredoxin